MVEIPSAPTPMAMSEATPLIPEISPSTAEGRPNCGCVLDNHQTPTLPTTTTTAASMKPAAAKTPSTIPLINQLPPTAATNGNASKPVVRLGFYDVGRTIGTGNYAVVKLGRHRVTKTEVAIKIVDKTRLDDSSLGKMRREVQVLKLLNHSHIIKLYQVMETKNMLYLVTEYAPNGDIFDLIAKEGKLSEADAREKFTQLTSAVQYCHNLRVVHRDLKAENLLLDASMNIKIADFGFSNYYQKDCEHLIRKMLVVDPKKRYTLSQVLKHRWITGGVAANHSTPTTPPTPVGIEPSMSSSSCSISSATVPVTRPQQAPAQITTLPPSGHCHPQPPKISLIDEPREQILKLMQSLGIDPVKTKESLRNESYDNFSAIYLLLLDRWRHKKSGSEQQLPGRRRQFAGNPRTRPTMAHPEAETSSGLTGYEINSCEMVVGKDGTRIHIDTMGSNRSYTSSGGSSSQHTAGTLVSSNDVGI